MGRNLGAPAGEYNGRSQRGGRYCVFKRYGKGLWNKRGLGKLFRFKVHGKCRIKNIPEGPREAKEMRQ